MILNQKINFNTIKKFADIYGIEVSRKVNKITENKNKLKGDGSQMEGFKLDIKVKFIDGIFKYSQMITILKEEKAKEYIMRELVNHKLDILDDIDDKFPQRIIHKIIVKNKQMNEKYIIKFKKNGEKIKIIKDGILDEVIVSNVK